MATFSGGPSTPGPDPWLIEQARARAEAGLHRELIPRYLAEDTVDLAGNDYLGLATHPEVVAAAVEAVQQWGAGAMASRLVTGTTELHLHLEQALAEFTGQPTALCFSSGYLANLGIVTALAGPDLVIISDAHIHASLIDACRLSRSRVVVHEHNSVLEVERALRERIEPRALVLCEGIYSALGDVGPVAELAALVEKYDATLLVDEAHSLGALGPGLVARAGLNTHPRVILTATLSKALGSQGGVVFGSALIREHLINSARPFIFDTGLAPAAAAAALAALPLVTDSRLRDLGRVVALLAADLALPPPPAAVLTKVMPSAQSATATAAQCAAAGVRVACFRPPSVPDGRSRLRITGRATLSIAELDRARRVLTANLPPC